MQHLALCEPVFKVKTWKLDDFASSEHKFTELKSQQKFLGIK